MRDELLRTLTVDDVKEIAEALDAYDEMIKAAGRAHCADDASAAFKRLPKATRMVLESPCELEAYGDSLNARRIEERRAPFALAFIEAKGQINEEDERREELSELITDAADALDSLGLSLAQLLSRAVRFDPNDDVPY